MNYKSGTIKEWSFIGGKLSVLINEDTFYHQGYDLESNVIFSLTFAKNHEQEVVYKEEDGKIIEIYTPVGLLKKL
jgi:hypothetical protein